MNSERKIGFFYLKKKKPVRFSLISPMENDKQNVFTFDNDLTVINITCNDSIIAGVSYNVSYGLLLHSDPIERSIASMKAKM